MHAHKQRIYPRDPGREDKLVSATGTFITRLGSNRTYNKKEICQQTSAVLTLITAY